MLNFDKTVVIDKNLDKPVWSSSEKLNVVVAYNSTKYLHPSCLNKLGKKDIHMKSYKNTCSNSRNEFYFSEVCRSVNYTEARAKRMNQRGSCKLC